MTEYTWDYHNRLTKVTEKNAQGTITQVVEYVYDVFDRRIGRTIDTSSPFDMANAVIERYVLDDIHNGLASADGGNVVLDFVDPDGSGAQAIAMSKRYLWGEAVDQLFAQEDLSKTLGDTTRNLWPLVDNLGTVRDLAKQDGTIAVHYKYDSYGNVKSGDMSKTRYLFTSREFDTATKLQYNRARYYDAAVGRWISEDPLGFVAGDGNDKRYVGNRLTGATDPSGLEWPWFWWPSWREYRHYCHEDYAADETNPGAISRTPAASPTPGTIGGSCFGTSGPRLAVDRYRCRGVAAASTRCRRGTRGEFQPRG